MTAGDIESNTDYVADNATLTIRPGSGAVWLIKQIVAEGEWDLYITDGSHQVKVETGNGPAMLDKRELIATHDHYFFIKNVSGTSAALYEAHVVMK